MSITSGSKTVIPQNPATQTAPQPTFNIKIETPSAYSTGSLHSQMLISHESTATRTARPSFQIPPAASSFIQHRKIVLRTNRTTSLEKTISYSRLTSLPSTTLKHRIARENETRIAAILVKRNPEIPSRITPISQIISIPRLQSAKTTPTAVLRCCW